ncbi:MAG: hypothetical protein ACK5Z5_06580 [Neisseriaceae bacterium]|jgi:hypothetical protein
MAIIHKSLYKTHRLFGVTGRIALFFVLLMMAFIFYAPFWGRIIGIVSVIAIWIVIALVNRYDSFGFTILWQYLKQQNFYPAHSQDTKYKYKYDKGGIR